MRISDWSSDVCSSDLLLPLRRARRCRGEARLMHGNGGLLLDSVIYLGFALVAVLLFRRLGLGATLGYLVAGALIGPHGLGLLGNTENIMALADRKSTRLNSSH